VGGADDGMGERVSIPLLRFWFRKRLRHAFDGIRRDGLPTFPLIVLLKRLLGK